MEEKLFLNQVCLIKILSIYISKGDSCESPFVLLNKKNEKLENHTRSHLPSIQINENNHFSNFSFYL